MGKRAGADWRDGVRAGGFGRGRGHRPMLTWLLWVGSLLLIVWFAGCWFEHAKRRGPVPAHQLEPRAVVSLLIVPRWGILPCFVVRPVMYLQQKPNLQELLQKNNSVFASSGTCCAQEMHSGALSRGPKNESSFWTRIRPQRNAAPSFGHGLGFDATPHVAAQGEM